MRNLIETLGLGLISLIALTDVAFAFTSTDDFASLPEPATLSLFAVGAVVLARKFRQRK